MSIMFDKIAEEIAARPAQVAATVALLDDGATVPFIARYRKEVTGGLDDIQLRRLQERLMYLRELDDRREAILKSIGEQEKLTPELAQQIAAADTKTTLEDLYLPYKPKRRTRAQIAREAGLQPLADLLFSDPTRVPEQEAEAFVNADLGVDDVKAALDGARHILIEQLGEDAALLGKLRDFFWSRAHLSSELIPGKEQEGAKYRDYFEFSEAVTKIPSHRVMALFRARNEGILNLKVDIPVDPSAPPVKHSCEVMIASHWQVLDEGRAADTWLQEVVRWTWRVKIHTHLQTDFLTQLRDQAEEDAIQVFARNIKDLLLAAPAGKKVTIGLDPGLRTGVKMCVVDATGRVLDHGAIFPTAPQNKTREAAAVLQTMCQKYDVQLIAIGNGTASRETDQFVADFCKDHPQFRLNRVLVNEAGASVYSASEFASHELPDLDVTIRGAVSIARRLQDPLAELVKIEPKSIGVGQYQHDVSQVKLSRSLDGVVEDCVNAVGVDVNSASAPLLKRVSGLTQSLVGNILEFRDRNGQFRSRDDLKKVPRFGDKTFEQAAGFLRIHESENPLDASSVHPESYPLVEEIARRHGREVRSLVGDSAFLRSLKAKDYISDVYGLPTVEDILGELEKPGRDPRGEFKTAALKDGVETLSDLKPAMVLEGTVTNVTNFGAFVDIGVHQDGLVHISALSDKFVKDPHDVVSAGKIVKVKVLEVDKERKRIALTMRLDDPLPSETGAKPSRSGPTSAESNKRKKDFAAAAQNKRQTGTMAALFEQALKNKR
ncbi:RNA-binding transcriptional accessory protein [Pseudohongiella acticola]|uniref:RNA-binding transcriptional accessory protein n=1 Tax=Pseudohongiella acticola TaxID=1524254 RepID=A0A1E8CGN1_9GAMM|nr:Tex family protein [Pseudohongiella acticola]OFE11593.1 RNA-binding transcriptional accessory protein [Pseudohongiella acticola]